MTGEKHTKERSNLLFLSWMLPGSIGLPFNGSCPLAFHSVIFNDKNSNSELNLYLSVER